MATPEAEFIRARELLGVGTDASPEAIKRAYLRQSYALIKRGATQEEKDQLKAAEALLTSVLAAAEQQRAAAQLTEATAVRREVDVARAVAEAERDAEREAQKLEPDLSPYDPRSFDSRVVNLVMPPAVAGVAVLAQLSPLAFLLAGFHVWIHEFGHAATAWLTGRRALPLPIGWTSVSPEKSNFVYFGILFLLTVLFVAGARERKIMPMIIAPLIAIVQYYCTWRLPEPQVELWFAFSGVGGEFYLSATMMGLFFFRLPEKFRWEICRYVFLFLGAGAFFKSWLLWKRIKRGEEGIPYGTMIHGEEDAGGDMNILHEDYGWTQRQIIHTYNNLADACVIALVVLYLVFALRWDRGVARMFRRWSER